MSLFGQIWSSRFLSFTVEGDMFNRTREMACLSDILLSTPQLSIITGPVNLGKTLLLENVFDQLPKMSTKPTPVYLINLRKGSFHSVYLLVSSLYGGMNSWVTKIIKNTTAEVSISAAGVKLQLKPVTNRSAIDDLNQLLEGVANLLLSTTLLRGPQVPVLYIDEPNLVKRQRRPGGFRNPF